MWASHCSGLSCCGARALGMQASVVVACGPSRSAACGILPGQGSNPCPLHWQADSQPLRHQRSPPVSVLITGFLHIKGSVCCCQRCTVSGPPASPSTSHPLGLSTSPLLHSSRSVQPASHTHCSSLCQPQSTRKESKGKSEDSAFLPGIPIHHPSLITKPFRRVPCFFIRN